eukprot:COSAG04_NODE_11998_length_676_cov_1.731369_2_plen_99_part_00
MCAGLADFAEGAPLAVEMTPSAKASLLAAWDTATQASPEGLGAAAFGEAVAPAQREVAAGLGPAVATRQSLLATDGAPRKRLDRGKANVVVGGGGAAG